MAAVLSLAPVIIGIGEIRQKDFTIETCREPAELILSAIRDASQDSSISVIDHVDSISVVPPWSWNYKDLPKLLAQRLDIQPSHLELASHGGNTPALLCDKAAARVASGEVKMAIVTGGEALASRAGATHSIGNPIQVYPLYENAYRKQNQQTYIENHHESAELYAQFDDIACQHPNSWRAGETPRKLENIKTVGKRNRMICTPYPLLMNAFNGVNLAAACIITSTEHATKLGIPREKWVYVTGGAGSNDSSDFWERSNYYSSPAIEYSIDNALKAAGLEKDEVDCFDLYSCFPIVPKIACKHVGLDLLNPKKPITLLGGLTSFGGAGNNYSLHAIAEMVRVIRKGKYQNGLVLANGGVLSWQHAICLSAKPKRNGSAYEAQAVLDNGQTSQGPTFTAQAQGEAIIETYTVDHDRSGPKLGHIIGRLVETGDRFIANHGDEMTLSALVSTSSELIGMKGFVEVGPNGRNVFTVDPSVKL
ncbi:unnamed protein product [Fusarium graminearum]|nr:unnamed protein product [Fusarium graminearum]